MLGAVFAFVSGLLNDKIRWQLCWILEVMLLVIESYSVCTNHFFPMVFGYVDPFLLPTALPPVLQLNL